MFDKLSWLQQILSTSSVWNCIGSEEAKIHKTHFFKFSGSVEDTPRVWLVPQGRADGRGLEVCVGEAVMASEWTVMGLPPRGLILGSHFCF